MRKYVVVGLCALFLCSVGCMGLVPVDDQKLQIGDFRDAFKATLEVISEYAFVTGVQKSCEAFTQGAGRIHAELPQKTMGGYKTRIRILAYLVPVHEDFTDIDIQVVYEIDTSDPSILTPGMDPAQWESIGRNHTYETILKNLVWKKLGGEYLGKLKKMQLAPPKDDGEKIKFERNPAAVALAGKLKKTIRGVNFSGKSFADSVSALSEIGGINIVMSGYATQVTGDTTVTLKVRDIPLKDAVSLLVSQAPCKLSWNVKNNVVFIDGIPPARKIFIRPEKLKVFYPPK